MIAGAMKAAGEGVRDLVQQAFDQMRDEQQASRVKLTDEIASLKLEVARLTMLLATIREERAAARGGNVIDLPRAVN